MIYVFKTVQKWVLDMLMKPQHLHMTPMIWDDPFLQEGDRLANVILGTTRMILMKPVESVQMRLLAAIDVMYLLRYSFAKDVKDLIKFLVHMEQNAFLDF